MRPGYILNIASGLQWNFRARLPTIELVSAHTYTQLRYQHQPPKSTPTMASPQEAEAAPAAGPKEHTPTIVELNDKKYEPVKEGLAYILKPVNTDDPAKPAPKPRGSGMEQQESVFYNPIQQFNRDLSVLAIKVFSEHFVTVAREQAAIHRSRRSRKKNEKKRKREESDGGNEGEVPKKHEAEGQAKDADVAAVLPESNTGTGNTNTDNQTNGEAKPISFKILDALSATGLRALRYAKEIPAATRIVSNDLSASAIEAIKVNIDYNEVGSVVRPNVGDARAYMYSLQGGEKNIPNDEKIGRFDVIDLDPYGTAAPFLDAAIQGLSNGGLLCVTCTDAGVFASTGYLEKAFSLYGGVSVRLPHGHEVGLRLILNAIATIAGKYGLSVEPLLSLSIDYYARVFVRIHKSPAEVKFLSGNTMVVYNCDAGCGAWTTQYLSNTRLRPNKNGGTFYYYSLAQAPTASPTCEHCGFRTHLGGPMWGGPLHNHHFVHKILKLLPELDPETYQTLGRIEGMLTTALEEDLDLSDPPKSSETVPEEAGAANQQQDPSSSPLIPRLPPQLQEKYPFFVRLSSLCKVLHAETIPMNAFRGALHGLGYRTTRSHTKANSVRTDAPWSVIWEIMREWVRQKCPIKEGTLKPGTAGAGLMKKDRSKYEVTNALSALRKEINEALESGTDVSDLTMKVEAALYRKGSAGLTTAPPATTSQNHKDGKEEEKPHPSTLNIVFDESLGREFSTTASSSSRKVARYPMNPDNWGPMSRAFGN
jgi:tRNA (guanine26-N2/guanine27-N2)-dimethyltransferase